MRTAALALLVSLGAAALPGCSPDPTPPSVLVVTIDTLRADAVSAWGRETGTTPAIDSLATAGVRFDRATTVTPLTLPAHASLLTAVRPGRHGLTVNGVTAADGLAHESLASTLRRRGYATGAFLSAAVLDRRHGLAAGFDHYDDDLAREGGPALPTERRGDRTVDRALDWLAQCTGPWFAWVHLFDPHAPYAAPAGRTGTDRPAYLDEVRFADEQVGRLLAALRGHDDGPVLVVLTSDHGEGLGEHGEETHGVLLQESTLHVPFVVAWWGDGDVPAGFPERGVVRTDVASILDVTPTILDVLGLPATPDVDGASLRTPRRGRPLPLESRSSWFYYGFSPLAGVRRDEVKLVGAPESSPAGWIAYDLAVDPNEQRGRPAADHDLVPRVLPTAPPVEAEVTGDDDVLRALGYLGAAPPTDEAGTRVDPRDALDLVRAIDRANTALVDGRPAAALALLDPVTETWVAVPELRLFRGKTLRALGRVVEAAAELEIASRLRPESADILVERGRALLAVADLPGGDPEPARQVLDRALALSPLSPAAIALRALWDVVFGDAEDGLARLDAALEERPHATNLLAVKLRALQALARDDEADVLRERLARLAPGAVDG